MKIPEEAERYVEGAGVSVITEGNGVKWDKTARIWLPDSVSYELAEAGVLNYIKMKIDSTSGFDIYVYHLAD